LLLKEMATLPLRTVTSNASLYNALESFNATRLDSIPVIDNTNGKLTGVITKQNVHRALLKGYPLSEPIDQFIIANPLTINENEDYQSLAELIYAMQIGHVVVVNDLYQPVGVIAKIDLIRVLLNQSESLSSELETVLNNIDNGVLSINDQRIISFSNEVAKQLLGKDVVNKCVHEVLPQFVPLVEKALLERQSTPWQKIALQATTLLVSTLPINNSSSNSRVTVLLQDNTKYENLAKEAETYKKLNATLELVIANAYDGIIVTQEDGKISFINQAVSDLTGIPEDELIGNDLNVLFPQLNIDHCLQTMSAKQGELLMFSGQKCVVDLFPIYYQEQFCGLICKLTFRGLDDLKLLAKKIESLEHEIRLNRTSSNTVEFPPTTEKILSVDDIPGISKGMENCKREARRAALTTSSVLITGETGTGKDVFARAIHLDSHREGRYVKINCAAIPDQLLESELFGYEEGAFTGAKKGGKPGKIELANGGTLFLDEIGDMPLGLQAKLLRVLQDKEFERVGGIDTVVVDIRVIAATNKPLKELVANNSFREDLYYRLNVFGFQIPPLRERKEDIICIANFLIQKLNHILGTDVTGLSPATNEILLAYNWPGNIRELENVLERAVNLAYNKNIEAEHLPDHLKVTGLVPPILNQPATIETKYRRKLQTKEQEILLQALEECKGNKVKAAKLLGISRSTFYEKLKKFSSERTPR